MSHDHSHHHHDHSHTVTKINTAFVTGIALNLLFVMVQVCVGIHINSMSLLSDAGHNFADVGSLAISLLAFKLMKAKSSRQYTYGYKKASVLTALLNAVILLVSLGAILYEAIRRLVHPEPVAGLTVAVVSGIGIVINTVSALFFLRDKEADMNIKSAYLHLMSDALVSLALVIGGVVIFYTGWYWIDGALSILVAVVIIIATWKLLKGSLRLSLDGVPENIDINEIKNAALKINGVKDFHHIHIWALSTTENALTAHLVVGANTIPQEIRKIKHTLKHSLQHLNIQHATIETETESQPCEESDCK